MKIVDEKRADYGLKPLGELRASGQLKDILTQQKEETVEALSVVARPVPVSGMYVMHVKSQEGRWEPVTVGDLFRVHVGLQLPVHWWSSINDGVLKAGWTWRH